MPSISEGSNVFTANVVTVGANYIKFEASWISSSSTFKYDRYVKLQISGHGTIIITSDTTGGANSYFSYDVYGLSPNTTYSWTATLGWGDANGGKTYSTWAIVSGTFKTKKVITIDAWNWNKSNGEASAAQTQQAYNILNGDVSVGEGFSHKVWNDFVDKVMDVRGHLGDGTWDTMNGTYLSYANCKVSPGDTLSAHMYNSVKTQIGQYVNGGTWANVSSGDRLYGWHIINLANKLNNLIDQL